MNLGLLHAKPREENSSESGEISEPTSGTLALLLQQPSPSGSTCCTCSER
jgi:hypothetical protein